jgi:hypothetical protein
MRSSLSSDSIVRMRALGGAVGLACLAVGCLNPPQETMAATAGTTGGGHAATTIATTGAQAAAGTSSIGNSATTSSGTGLRTSTTSSGASSNCSYQGATGSGGRDSLGEPTCVQEEDTSCSDQKATCVGTTCTCWVNGQDAGMVIVGATGDCVSALELCQSTGTSGLSSCAYGCCTPGCATTSDNTSSASSTATTTSGGTSSGPSWNGRGFQDPVAYPIPSQAGSLGLAVADLDLDGNPDIVTAAGGAPNGVVQIQFGVGDGTFQSPVRFTSPAASHTVVVGDVDSDGLPDVLVSAVNATSIWVLHNQGGRGFANQQNVPTSGATEMVVADFNGDGKMDLAAASDGALAIFVGGDGGLALSQMQAAFVQPDGIVAVDLDRDGHLDLAVDDFGSDMMWVFRGAGDGTFDAPSQFPTGTTRTLAAADTNGDGLIDLLSTNGGEGGDVTIFLNQAQLVFGSALPSPIETFPVVVATGDFNGDGTPDVAVGDNTSNDLSIGLGRGDGTFVQALAFGGIGAWAIDVADFNHDGKPDLAVLPPFGQTINVLLGK